MDLVQLSDVSKNLYILPGGTVPPNPTELLARDGLDKAIETLKKNFDYVILDTAPVGMVTDTLFDRTCWLIYLFMSVVQIILTRMSIL